MNKFVNASVGLAIVASLYFSAPAHAANFSVLPESSGKIGIITGEIDQGDTKRLSKFLVDHKRIESLLLDSPGGYIAEGIWMADKIRTAKLKTVVFDECASACFLLFAAGTERTVIDGANIGIHAAASVVGEEQTFNQEGTDWTAKELDKLGVPNTLIETMKSTHQPDVHWLTADEETLMGVKIVND